MSDNKSPVVYSGGYISTTGLLGCALVILKLTHSIEISWFWALAPFWVGWAALLLILLIVCVPIIVLAVWDDYKRKKRWAKKK